MSILIFRLKDKVLTALRENNRRILYLKSREGLLPIPILENKTHEKIVKHHSTDTIRGITVYIATNRHTAGVYQRYYSRLLPYLNPATPEKHSQFWRLKWVSYTISLTILSITGSPPDPRPDHFLYDRSPQSILIASSLVSLNVVGLSLFGHRQRSHGTLLN